MSIEIHVPDIGNFSDVDVIEVLVNVGDTIAIDDALITLESDKASMDIPAPRGGVVKEIKIAVGDKVSEGSLILLLEDSAETSVNVASAAAQPKLSSSAAGATPVTAPTGLEEIQVPDIGNFKDVDVIEVLVQVGDEVAAEDSLITLESDKASMEIPSPKAGKVKEIKIAVGDKVSEGSLILVLEVAGAKAIPAMADAPAASAPITAPVATTAAAIVDAEAFRRAHASPSVRRIARELGVDLSKVAGTGQHGRITESDVRAYCGTGGQPVAAASVAAPAT
ncbi:MAG: biotin/lipoyl-containing protein, partial [Thiothrix sp.]